MIATTLDTTTMNDRFADLFERAKGGDADAQGALLERHLNGLRAFVRLKSGRLLRARESCSDLVQTVCREALRDLSAIDCGDETGFKKWLYTVAHHKLQKRVLYHQRQKRDAARDADGRTGHDAGLLDAYGSICSPSRQAQVREEIERIEDAFDRLSEEHRHVITEICLLGRSHREVAGELGRTELAMRKMLSRARVKLAMLLR